VTQLSNKGGGRADAVRTAESLHEVRTHFNRS
jgi:hypothetical protein